MVGIGEFSRAVAKIHEAPGRPDMWHEAMIDLTRILGATAATIALNAGSERTVLDSTLATEATAPYLEHYRRMDFVMAACERGPVGLVQGGWDLVRAHERTEFHNDWQRRFDITDGLTVRLGTATQASFVVSTLQGDEPFATAERVAFVDALMPHLRRALDAHAVLSDRPGQTADGTLADPSSEMRLAVDAIRHGVVLVDRRCRIVGMNAAAAGIAALGDGLGVHTRFLRASEPQANAGLRAAVERATAPGVRMVDQVVCRRPSGRRPYVLHVVPVGDDGDPDRRRATVLIVDTDARPGTPDTLLREMFGLTSAEARVALRLLESNSVSEVADALSLSAATVKTHLQKIYRKTGTSGHAGLVRLLMSLQP